MGNVPAHKVEEIEPLILSKGASVLYQSPYSPDSPNYLLSTKEYLLRFQ